MTDRMHSTAGLDAQATVRLDAVADRLRLSRAEVLARALLLGLAVLEEEGEDDPRL